MSIIYGKLINLKNYINKAKTSQHVQIAWRVITMYSTFHGARPKLVRGSRLLISVCAASMQEI